MIEDMPAISGRRGDSLLAAHFNIKSILLIDKFSWALGTTVQVLVKPVGRTLISHGLKAGFVNATLTTAMNR
jgi:hypothetical protein